jgi:hypothetical protein
VQLQLSQPPPDTAAHPLPKREAGVGLQLPLSVVRVGVTQILFSIVVR